MNALSDYQKNILSHMGICQWQLRDDVAQDVVQPASVLSEVNEPAPQAQVSAASSLAAMRESLAPQKQQPITQPLNESGSDVHVSPMVESDKPQISVEQPKLTISNSEHPLVQDVLLALNLSSESLQEQTFTWQIGENIALNGQMLITPELNQLGHSISLKQQLWQAIQQWQR